MAIRVRCKQVICMGLLMLSMAHAQQETKGFNFSSGAALAYSLGHSVEAMFAQLPLQEIDEHLVSLALEMSYGKTPAQVIEGIGTFCKNTGMPLMKVSAALIKQHNYIGAALKVAQCLLDVLPVHSVDYAEVQAWISDLAMMESAIQYVALIIKSNPQLVAAIIKVVA